MQSLNIKECKLWELQIIQARHHPSILDVNPPPPSCSHYLGTKHTHLLFLGIDGEDPLLDLHFAVKTVEVKDYTQFTHRLHNVSTPK